MARVVWPFPSLTPAVESLEWRTDILRSKATEQRIALRTHPRRSFSYSHYLTDEEAAAARRLIQFQSRGRWVLRPRLDDSALMWGRSPRDRLSRFPATSPLTTTADKAVIWSSPTRHEVVDVTWDSSAAWWRTRYLGAYQSASVLPVFEGDTEGLSVSQSPKQGNFGNISFVLTEAFDLASSSLDQYRGLDILATCPEAAVALDTETGYPVAEIDNAVGITDWIRARDIPDQTLMMRWRKQRGSDLLSLVQWLHSRRGRQKAFWFPSFTRDYTPLAFSGSTLTVHGAGSPPASSFHIEIALPNSLRASAGHRV